MGVDLVDRMIERARQRAKVEGVEDRVEFSMADARALGASG